jgi:hypothetical protein
MRRHVSTRQITLPSAHDENAQISEAATTLLLAMISVDGHLPSDGALTLRVLVVILGWKLALLLAYNFSAATQTTINPRMIGSLAGLKLFIECFIVALNKPVRILVESHAQSAFVDEDRLDHGVDSRFYRVAMQPSPASAL